MLLGHCVSWYVINEISYQLIEECYDKQLHNLWQYPTYFVILVCLRASDKYSDNLFSINTTLNQAWP